MTLHAGSAVWSDHQEAHVFRVTAGSFDESVVEAPTHHTHRHPKGPTAEHHHPDDMHRFFADVAKALGSAERILVMGPSTAKLQFLRYLREHTPVLEPRAVGIETVDHPTDRQIISTIRNN